MLAIATLVVSIVMTGLTFFALNGIQTEARMGDTRYARDLGLLLASNVTPLAAQNNDRELARVTEEFWRSSRSLRYIFYADPEGVIYLGIPISKVDSGNDLLLSRRLELPADLRQRPQNPLIRQHLTPDGLVTDVFVPMVNGKDYLGVMALAGMLFLIFGILGTNLFGGTFWSCTCGDVVGSDVWAASCTACGFFDCERISSNSSAERK